MKISKVVAPVVLAAATFLGASAANAELIVHLASGGSFVQISDGDALDLNDGANGVLSVSVNFNGWNVVTTNGTSVTDPFQMHLGTTVSGNGGESLLTVRLTQTDITAASLSQLFSANGAVIGAGTGSWSAWVDDSNAAFGTATQVANSANGSFLDVSTIANMSGLFSATIVQTFDFSGLTVLAPGKGQYGVSADVDMKVPEPTSIALVGLALLAAGFASRRKA